VGIPGAVAVVAGAGAIAQTAARWLRMVTMRGNLSAVGVGVREVVAVAVTTVVVEAGDVGASRAGPGGTTIVTTPLAGGTRLRSATELAVVTGALLKRQLMLRLRRRLLAAGVRPRPLQAAGGR